MKSSRKILPVVFLAAGAWALRGELTKWAENIDATSRLENVFFKSGMRRPPVETRADLSKLIAAAPSDEELYSLRALEAEQQLDFTAAEADWKKCIDVAKDKGSARVALADYYHRRLQSVDELNTLALAARENAPDSEKLLPVSEQRPWKIYERLIRLVNEQELNPSLGGDQYVAWIQRYPDERQLYTGYFRFAMDHQRYEIATVAINTYKQHFPKDEEFPIEAQAELESKIGTPAQAMAVYEKSFRPLWPAPLVTQFFELLKQTSQLRVYLEKARAGVAAKPEDLASAARLFYYWQQQGNTAAAERALTEFRTRKKTWTPDELLTMGRLFESIHNYDEAARNYYALYSAARADEAMAETGLGSLARLMLTAPEQPIRFGSGNLSLYRDTATMDPHPGFLNGVLSLLMNDSDASEHYTIEEQSAAPYFRRMRAGELVALFETRFPKSPARADLRERVIETYAIYGSTDGVIRAGQKFLTDFPDAENRTAVAMRMADAYARGNRTREEFAVYDSLLLELAKRAAGVPLGAILTADKAANDKLRSPEYARVLDRYVARLVGMKRVPDALALYRREIDRNPNDPGLYDTLAAFLDQNKLGGEVEGVYKRAMAQFPDRTWDHKLARWYLRQKRQADVARLTRDVVKTFSGTELESYFGEIVHTSAPVGPALALQLNVYAHQRFPHNLTFVRNLLAAYSTAATRNDVAYDALLRQQWYYADDLRVRFFERLSRTGKLDAELAAAKVTDPAGQRMLAEGEAWRGHFEAAAPLMLAMETNFPADRTLGRRAAAVYRSLDQIPTGIAVEERLAKADPRDHEALTLLGEMEQERGRPDLAAADWNKLAEIEPSRADAYLEAATVFWDYYRYDDALRLIEQARQRLKKPDLFAYEAGAIRENQRVYDFAAREYARGAMAQPASMAQARLLLLARRPGTRADIEQLTTNLVSARNPQMGAFQLRVALLRNQNRRDDLERLLLDIAARANVPELLGAVETDARVDGFTKAQQAAIERQIAVATDPVERMRLRLGLARFFEGQGQTAQGAAVVDALYRENPAILGVIRAAVDYHWRNKDPRRAVDDLEQAAARAAAGYRGEFTLEAARKATESGDYTRARGFVAKLMAAAPDNAEYVAAMADTYARQGDDRGLRTFYESKIRATKGVEQIAAMRRALIPVLTRMKDFNGGVDQYIEVLNRYPEDDGLAREAALYASANGAGARLRDYYVKAANDSPKDYRWPMVLARIDVGLEDFPSAIAAYTRASGVRPDRTDLLTARLDLEVRTMRFDEAAATATKLYDLTYRNPQWMEKLAEIRARQGRSTDTVAALQKAWIEGRPASAANLLEVARRLDGWGMLPEARRFADQAMKLSPDDALGVWARIAMRQREFDAVLGKLAAAKGGTLAAEMGRVVKESYSPEEKARFVASLEGQTRRLEVAAAADLLDVEMKWTDALMMATPGDPKVAEWKQKLIETQENRLAFDELGAQLEAFAKLPSVQGTEELLQAEAAYRSSGNTAAESRVLQMENDQAPLEGPMFDRYAQLLMAQPQRLVAAVSRERRAEVANALVNYAMEHGTAAVAQQAVAARGTRMGGLWTRGYTALTGMYFGTHTAPVRTAFTSILGDMTIGARIGKPVDRKTQLAGDWWFYYAGRYGEYASSADFLPATVEANPARSDAYFALAEYYRAAGNAAAALENYRAALELRLSRADVHDRLAVMASAASQDEAVKEWKLAIQALSNQMNSAHVPQTFWTDFNDTLHHIGDAKALGPLRGDIDKVLRVYIHRNGPFQVEPLFEGVMAAGGDLTWISDLSTAAADPSRLLSSIIEQPWVPEAQKDILYTRMVDSARARVASAFGDARTSALSEVWAYQIQQAEYLLRQRQNQKAAAVIGAFGADALKDRAQEVIPLELRVAGRLGTLAAQLKRYDEPATLEILRSTANEMTKDGEAASARTVLGYAYTRELKTGSVDASIFLGLAEVRIEEKDLPGALTLLRRMSLISGEAFTGLDPAAGLLEKTGHPAEAAEFLSSLVKAEPWNWDARERLASAQGSVSELAVVAKSGDASYGTRVLAAQATRRLKGPAITGTDAELALLSQPNPPAEADASKPYFYASRIDAASASRDAAVRDRLLAAAILIDPKPEQPKLDLMRASLDVQHDAKHDARAVGIAEKVGTQSIGEQTDFTPWVASGFFANLPDAERVALARGLGDAEQRLGDTRVALLFYQVAQAIQPAPRIQTALDVARRRVDAMAKNEGRRPVVTDHLDQDRLVRARVSVP